METRTKTLRSRHFEVRNEEIRALVFADHSDSDADSIDNEDYEFLEKDIEVSIDEQDQGFCVVIDDADVVPEPADVYDSEDDMPLSTFVLKKTRDNIEWSSAASLIGFPEPDVRIQWGKVTLENVSSTSEPIDLFMEVSQLKKLASDVLVPQTNLYATQSGRIFETTPSEMLCFIGVNFLFGYHKLPTFHDYWSGECDVSVPFVGKHISRNKFVELRRNLHFNDNTLNLPTSHPNHDRTFKLTPVINHFKAAFKSAMQPTERQSVDEHMIKFKGNNHMKQYMKNKPIKWGFKVWCRCCSETGYLFDFNFYTGKKINTECGLGESVVKDLVECLHGTCCKVYFDNFFTTVDLVADLLDAKVLACGTVRSNRKKLPKDLPADKQMKRGQQESRQCGGIRFVKWMDSKSVLVVSSACDSEASGTVQRRQKGHSEKVPVNCPEIIQDYNHNMGGVDLLDQKIVSYSLDRRSKIKFYLRPFFDLLDIAMVNSYVIWNKLNPNSKLTSLQFRRSVTRELISGNTSRDIDYYTKRSGKTDACSDKSAEKHLPEFHSSRKRCRLCADNKLDFKTVFQCTACKAPFCITNERNCFRDFHK
jgi:hypothetical protein